jgi:hypothetical protein
MRNILLAKSRFGDRFKFNDICTVSYKLRPTLVPRRHPGQRAGRARLSETAGSPATHRPIWPNAFASRNGSRPNGVQLRLGSCGLGETRPTRAVARHYPRHKG